MVSTHVDIDEAEWTPGIPFYGPAARYDSKDIVQLKVLSDRRAEGGGIAWLAKFPPPPGKLIKIVATALSDEHVFNLEGGRATKSGAPARASGGYTLNPTGQPHSALIATETVSPSSIPASRTRSCRWKSSMSPPETGIRSRPATQNDLTILWDFVAIAAYEPDADAAKAVPFVAAHLAGWQRPEDFGFIAERDGLAIGAAWARQFARDEQPAFFVDERTPEITIGVKPHIRGRGVGRMLLHSLFAEAARRGVGLCLNVRHDNPARHLYERVGFRLVPESGVPNRVGGTSFGMLWSTPR